MRCFRRSTFDSPKDSHENGGRKAQVNCESGGRCGVSHREWRWWRTEPAVGKTPIPAGSRWLGGVGEVEDQCAHTGSGGSLLEDGRR
jgi:hypothetical protein